MRLRSMAIKASIVLGIIAVLSIVSVRWQGSSPDGKGSSGIGIFLAKPTFAQEAEVSFLDEEAGIAAYVNLSQKIDMAEAKAAFRTVEKETSTYMVGSVPVPGYESTEEEDVHCFIHEDGWIVAYYLRDEPTSKIMYWKNWSGRTIGTKVKEGLISAIGATGLAPTEVRYYHFKYPTATKLMIIADTDSYKVTIPSELVIYERSFSITSYPYYFFYIDNKTVGGLTGLIPNSQMEPDVPHVIKGWRSGNNRYGSSALVLVFQEF